MDIDKGCSMQKFMDKLYNAWLVLSTPGCWVTIRPCSLEWDEALNKLLDRYDFTPEIRHDGTADEYCAFLGHVLLWTSNRPYNCFYPYNAGPTRIPKRSTMVKANKKFEAYLKLNNVPTELQKVIDSIEP